MMMRIGLIAILCVLCSEAGAQTVYNPDSPRGRRELEVHPPAPAAAAGMNQTIEPERWGNNSKPVGQTTWGSVGAAGWVGVRTPPAGAPAPAR